MASVIESPAHPAQTLADLLKQLGNISPDRVRYHPLPGTAKVQDVIDIERAENRLYELVDGVLVEKAMGFRESILAAYLIRILQDHVLAKNLGLVTAPDGTMEVLSGQVRIPDVAFISWARLPDGKLPSAPIPKLAPDLVIEILSPSNTAEEMERKRREYFQAGVRVAWFIDPDSRTAAVYTAVDKFTTLSANSVLSGEPVLPGFKVSLADLFAELDRRAK